MWKMVASNMMLLCKFRGRPANRLSGGEDLWEEIGL